MNTDKQQTDLILFVDSNEKAGIAYKSTPEAFVGSWERPNWHIFMQPPLATDKLAQQ